MVMLSYIGRELLLRTVAAKCQICVHAWTMTRVLPCRPVHVSSGGKRAACRREKQGVRQGGAGTLGAVMQGHLPEETNFERK